MARFKLLNKEETRRKLLDNYDAILESMTVGKLGYNTALVPYGLDNGKLTSNYPEIKAKLLKDISKYKTGTSNTLGHNRMSYKQAEEFRNKYFPDLKSLI